MSPDDPAAGHRLQPVRGFVVNLHGRVATYQAGKVSVTGGEHFVAEVHQILIETEAPNLFFQLASSLPGASVTVASQKPVGCGLGFD